MRRVLSSSRPRVKSVTYQAWDIKLETCEGLPEGESVHVGLEKPFEFNIQVGDYTTYNGAIELSKRLQVSFRDVNWQKSAEARMTVTKAGKHVVAFKLEGPKTWLASGAQQRYFISYGDGAGTAKFVLRWKKKRKRRSSIAALTQSAKRETI
mmetsp:Transcript_21475/g.23971  ORF Transcript_21475/g.23971 Transcript_21475/m.23971 type:complete len:152 (+) Transcript_21475:84-539(+)